MDDTQKDQVLAHVDRAAMLDLAKRLISIPSFKPNETPVARFLDDYFRERGYEVELQEVELQEVEPGRYQAIATLKGSGGGRSLMLNGHTDINSLRRGAKRDPTVPIVEGDRLYGQGVENMKGGLGKHDRRSRGGAPLASGTERGPGPCLCRGGDAGRRGHQLSYGKRAENGHGRFPGADGVSVT